MRHIGEETCNLYNVEGYTFENRPKSAGKGGGIAIYIHKGSRCHDLEIDEIKGIWIEIFLPRSKLFLICILYRPPDGSDYLHNNFTNLLNDMFINASGDSKEIIVTGDLNINFMKRTDHLEIRHLLSLYGFKQLVQSATCITDNSQSLIDVIMSNHAEHIIGYVIPTSFSNHDMIGCVQ